MKLRMATGAILAGAVFLTGCQTTDQEGSESQSSIIESSSIESSGMESQSSEEQVTDNQLKEGSAEEANMDEETLAEIDQIVEAAMEEKIIPGAVVFIAKDNTIVKETAYGYAQKFDMGEELSEPIEMTTDTVFDLASVTKVMATTQGIMKLVSEGEISVDDQVAMYVPDFSKNGKEEVTIADLLTHTSGLTPWEPTYLTAKNREEVLDYINDLPLEYETGTDRKYSDFSFMMLAFILESITDKRLDEYLQDEIYGPLQMEDTLFNAAENTEQPIAATSWGNPYEYKMIEDDEFGYTVPEDPEMFDGWREYTLVGEINDGNGFYANEGIAGHAGLFSTAKDLAVLGQTMLNGGTYGDVELYSQEVLQTFTSPQRFDQGYGWELNKEWYMGDQHSDQTFGHTGFTGTQVIFDPEYNVQIIILTNKQNNGQKEDGSYASTGQLSQDISNKVYESIKK
ncbi:serine hydrolase [Jeotgalibaca dankookensis]|uniref:serine hydrolase n=1 Tax=Jeotgalibaca dankookensis TaxID=708126 RepID=UPI000A8140DC|nr:serine hydrolase [Jeotgalibaca dankookensis]